MIIYLRLEIKFVQQKLILAFLLLLLCSNTQCTVLLRIFLLQSLILLFLIYFIDQDNYFTAEKSEHMSPKLHKSMFYDQLRNFI